MNYVYNPVSFDFEGHHEGPDYPIYSTPVKGQAGQRWNGASWDWLPTEEEKYQASLLPPVPRFIKAWQAREILAKHGQLASAQALVDDPKTDRAILFFWNSWADISRDSPAMLTIADILGFTDSLDDWFREAGALEI